MKKLCLLLALLIMVTCIVGCGEKDNNIKTEETKDYSIAFNKLQNTFCDDNGKFAVSGTTATTHDWAYSNYYGRVITAEIFEENKITSFKIEYTDLDTQAYKSSEAISKFLKDDGSISAWDYLMLVPLYDLRDMMMLVGAKDSEITVKLISGLIEKGTSFEKNNWTVFVDIGDSSVTFSAEYGTEVE